MKKNTFPISFCCPIYNESPILEEQILFLHKKLSLLLGKNNFEIVIVNNGSTDLSKKKIDVIKHLVSYYSIPQKGHGLAFKKAIEKSRFEHIVLSAIDLPFGFSDLEKVLPIWEKYDIIFGSKAHPRSTISVPFSRKVASIVFRKIIQLFFVIPVSDTQGSIFLKRDKLLPFLQLCDAENAFFTTQLAIYSQLNKLKISEIPIIMQKRNLRNSKYSIVKDGGLMIVSLLKEYFVAKDKLLSVSSSKA